MDRAVEIDPDATLIAHGLEAARARLRADDAAAAIAGAQRAIDSCRAVAARFGGVAEPNAALQPLRRIETEAGLLLARASRRANQSDRAVLAVRAALQASQAAAEPALECRVRAEYARILAALGRNDDALAEAHAALQIAVHEGSAASQAAAYESFGVVHWTMAQWQDAWPVYQRVLVLAQTCGDTELCALAHAGLGASEEGLAMLAHARGDEAASREHWRRMAGHAAECARCWGEVGDLHNIGYARNMQAVSLLGIHDYVAARIQLESFLKALGPQQSARRTLALTNLAEVELAEQRPQHAIVWLREALAASERLLLPFYESVCCELLSQACERSGDAAAALAFHRRFHAIHVRLVSESSQARARAIAVVLETEQAQAGAEAQRQRAEQAESRNAALSTTAERLARDSLEDAMTGIANRRRFDELLNAEFAADAPPPACSLALIDVDHFKHVNDRFSHLIGDQVLRRIGAVLQRNCRRGDLAARYGGEEFVLVLDELDREAARAVCERVRRSIETQDWSTIAPQLAVTVSIGLAHGGETATADGPQALMALADARLYAAKHAGRNCLVDATPADPSNAPDPARSSARR